MSYPVWAFWGRTTMLGGIVCPASGLDGGESVQYRDLWYGETK